jgi:Flp pilus assembly protein protease CpaA
MHCYNIFTSFTLDKAIIFSFSISNPFIFAIIISFIIFQLFQSRKFSFDWNKNMSLFIFLIIQLIILNLII